MGKLLFTLLIAAGLACQHSSAKAQSKISPEAFETKLQQDSTIQLIDVRTPEEYVAGHIAGSVNMNIYDDDFAAQFGKLDKNRPVLVYCARGGRSADAAEQMAKAGYTQVFDLNGGFIAWKDAGKPVTKN